MSINLQKISDAINAKISSFGSSSPTSELVKIIESINNVNAHGGVITAPSKNALPLADSSNSGTIAFVRSTGYTDSAGTFYFGTGTDWSMLTTLSDSADSAGAASGSEGGGSTWQPGFNDIAGYATGQSTAVSTIQKWSHTSDGDASNVGDLAIIRNGTHGGSNSTTGWVVGAIGPYMPATPSYHRVDKFPFATETGVAAGDVSAGSRYHGYAMTEVAGYMTGGQNPYGAGDLDRIEKYTYASESSASIAATLASTNTLSASASSLTHGYEMGGYPYSKSRIEKFPFASEDTVTNVGDLLTNSFKLGGAGDATHGYTLGGQVGPPWTYQNVIQRFPFASDDNATDVGDLTVGRYFDTSAAADQSSTHGYGVGGFAYSPPGDTDTIDKFAFSSSSNATDVGNMLVATKGTANHSN